MTPFGPAMIVPNPMFPSGYGAQLPDGEWIPVDEYYAGDTGVCCAVQ